MISTGSGKRGSAPLQAGLATSLLLIIFGFTAVFCWAMAAPVRTVYLSSFTGLWVVLASLVGGLTAGVFGRTGMWRRAGMPGMVVGVLALLLLWGISPGSPTVWEIAACLVVLPVISSLGALLGANLAVSRNGATAVHKRTRATRSVTSKHLLF